MIETVTKTFSNIIVLFLIFPEIIDGVSIIAVKINDTTANLKNILIWIFVRKNILIITAAKTIEMYIAFLETETKKIITILEISLTAGFTV